MSLPVPPPERADTPQGSLPPSSPPPPSPPPATAADDQGAIRRFTFLLILAVVVGGLALVLVYRLTRSTFDKLEPHLTVYLTLDEFKRVADDHGIEYQGPIERDRGHRGCRLCITVPLNGSKRGKKLEIEFFQDGGVASAYIRNAGGDIERQLITSDPR